MKKLTTFKGEPVTFVETTQIDDGIQCDVYSFVGDTTKDLGIITVRNGSATPLQRVLEGTSTKEGYLAGKGSLTVETLEGITTTYYFSEQNRKIEVSVTIGQTMQWKADRNSDLQFYEICEPPYTDDRFENLAVPDGNSTSE